MASRDSGQTEYIEITQRKPAHLAAEAPSSEPVGEATTVLEAEPTTAMEAGPTTLLTKKGATELLDETPQTELLPNSPAADDGEDEALIALRNLEERRRKKRRQTWLKVGAGAVAVAAVAAWFGLRGRMAPPQDVVEGPATAVVMKQDFTTTVQGTGALQPISTTVVTPEVDGIIDTVNVSEGQMVKIGDVLFTIRSEQIDKAIASAADSLADAQNSLGQASNSYGETQAAIAKDRAAYETASAQAAADKAKAQEAYDKAYHQHDDAIAAAKGVYETAYANEKAALAAQDATEGAYLPKQEAFEAAKAKFDLVRDYFGEAHDTWDYLTQKMNHEEELTTDEKQRFDVLDGPDGVMIFDNLDLNSLRTLYRALYGEYLIDLNSPWPLEDPRNPCLKKAMDEAAGACVTPRETYEAAILKHDQAVEALADAQVAYDEALAAADAAAQAAAAVIPITAVPPFSEASAQAQLDGAQASVTAAANAVDAAQKAYEQAVEAASKRTVKSPIAGTVMSVGAVAGQAVGSGASGTGTLVKIANISKMEVTIQVKEIDISDIKEGQAATCTFSALPGVELKGVVTSVASTSTSGGEGSFGGGVVTYAVTIRIDKPGTKVKPGMTATVNIKTQDAPDVLVIPAMALEEADGKAYVYVVVDQETYATERREVTLGARSTTDVVVTSGLSEGDVILLSAGEALPTDGASNDAGGITVTMNTEG
jgi:RND family efflux transporter MFP subunit